MTASSLQLLALFGAFWTAVLLYRGERPGRFVAGLALGAVCAHAGWALLHLDAVRSHPSALLDPATGYSVLFVPLGLALLERSAAAFAALPLALAVARLGCLAAGCCHGPAGEPTPLAEIAGLVALHFGVRHLPHVWIAPVVLAVFGLLRLALEPWRAVPPLGEPALPAALLAAMWVAAGLFVAGGTLRSARLAALLMAAFVAAQPVRAGEPPADAVLATLPFLDSDEPNRIVLDLAPEGRDQSFRLMLDTGASHSVLSPGMARQLGVRVRRVKPDPYRRKTILGRDLLFYVQARSSDTGSRTGYEYGLLGGNFLESYVVEIDFPGRRVRFLDARKYEVPESTAAEGEAVVPLRVVGKRPGVALEVNGHETLVLIDTGSPSTLISGKVAEAAGVASESIPGWGAGSLLGPVDVELAAAGSVRLGPFTWQRMPIEVAPHGFFNLGFPGDSLLGYDLLAQFVVRLDYRRQRMWLRRDPAAARPTFFGADYALYERSGALLAPTGREHTVFLIRPESPAARRGLRPGDRFGGESSAASIADAIESGEALVLLRGEERVEIPTAD